MVTAGTSNLALDSVGMLLAIPRGSPITYFGRTGSSGTVVIGGVRRINERCVGSATDKRSEGGVSISQAWSRRRRQVFDAVTVRATAADDVEQEEVVDKEEDAHEEAASSSREAPKISRFEQQQQRRTSKVRKQAGPRNPVGIFSNLVEEWTTFTSKREKGDIRDVILMSLSFAGSVVAVQKPYTAVMIVPTGTGASIGGFAGDSLPVARAMASVADCLITHPNVLNGAMLYWPMPNALYVEGYALDKFAEGSWGLQPVHQNRVGLVLDAGMEEEMRARHLQVADAACATLGLPMLEYTVTDMPLQVEKWVDSSGASTGRLGRPDSLMRAVNNLVKGGEVDAVAVVARFPDDSCEELVDYRQGKGVDVLAGVEAIISHMVVQEFQIPCAHAPALALLPFDQTISPRSAAEEIGFTFLPCVLVGLSRAPQYVSKVEFLRGGTSPTFWASDVDCVVVPFNACGGAGTLAFAKMAKHKPLILAVEENETVLNDTPEKLKLDAMRVANYWEALGVMAAHKAGVDPQALRRNGVSHLRRAHISSTSADVFPRSVLVAR